MKAKRYKQIDMTQGNILSSIISFSLPLLAGSLLQTMYNTVDSVIIGNFVSTKALAAVSACRCPMMILLAVLLGLSNGISVLVAQVFGSGESDKIEDVIATANGFFVLSAIPLTIGSILLINPLLSVINIPAAVRGDAYIYLLIVFGGLIGAYGYNLNAGLLRGLGDSRSPLLFLMIACLVNLALDLFFVLVMQWGVFGVALATVIAQMISWLYSLWHIKHHFAHINYRLFSMQIHTVHLKKMLSVGLPMVMNNAVFSFGFLIYYRYVNAFGSAFMAGYGIAGKLENLTWLPISSLGTAAVTFAGQNSGVGNLEWMNKGVKLFLKTTIAINLLTSAILLLWGRQMLGIFTPDAAVIEAGYAYLFCVSPFYWIYAIIHILSSFMNGVGDVKIPTLITLLMFWGVRLPVAWYMSLHFSGNLLHIAYPVSWIAGCIMTVFYYMTKRWQGGIITSFPVNAESKETA